MVGCEPGRVFEAVIAKSMNTASRAVADEGEVRPLAELGLSCCFTLVINKIS